MKFSIKRKDIRAMLHLAAKKDIRYYLQGINVVRDNRGTYIEATDGHVLGRLLIDGIRSDTKQNVVLPTDALLKLKGTKKQGDEWLSFSVEGLAVECIDSQSTTPPVHQPCPHQDDFQVHLIPARCMAPREDPPCTDARVLLRKALRRSC